MAIAVANENSACIKCGKINSQNMGVFDDLYSAFADLRISLEDA
jgi:hypothetical protein